MQSVLDEVIDELKLNTDYLKLQKKITTNNPSGTRILEVKAEAATPKLAVKIADAVCRIGVERINDSIGFKQVNISEEGKLNTNRATNRVSRCTLSRECSRRSLSAAFMS